MRYILTSSILAVLALPGAVDAQLHPDQLGDSERVLTPQRVSVFENAVRSRTLGHRWAGPYSATLSSDPSRPSLSLYSLDFAQYVYPAMEWTVNVAGIGSGADLATTRLGNGAGSLDASLERYRQAAFLASQFQRAAISQYAGIHGAIWQIMTPDFSSLVTRSGGDFDALTGDPSEPESLSFWLSRAEAEADAGFANTNLDDWRILTDTRVLESGVGRQPEFMTRVVSVPEPQTWALILPALLLVSLAGRRHLREKESDFG